MAGPSPAIAGENRREGTNPAAEVGNRTDGAHRRSRRDCSSPFARRGERTPKQRNALIFAFIIIILHLIKK